MVKNASYLSSDSDSDDCNVAPVAKSERRSVTSVPNETRAVQSLCHLLVLLANLAAILASGLVPPSKSTLWK